MAETVRAGGADDFQVGKFTILRLGGREVGIIKLSDGQIHAVLNNCPHRVAPICKGHVGGTWPPAATGELRFDREGEVLTCPRHGWEFDLRSGNELYQDRPARLRKYPVTVEDGNVLVTI